MRKLLFILAILPSLCWPATQTITGLPYTVTAHSADTWDTLVIDSDSLIGSQGGLHSDSMGVIFSAADNDYWLIDLSGDDGIPGNADDDSIVFGMDSSYYVYGNYVAVVGIYLGSAGSADSVIIRGGYIVHLPTGVDENNDYATDGKLAVNAIGVFGYWGMKNCVFDSVAEIMVKGFGSTLWGGSSGSHAVYCRGTGILFRNTTIKTRHYGYNSRTAFVSNIVKYGPHGGGCNALDGNQTYHIRFEDCYIDAIGHCGLALVGAGDNNFDSLFVVQVESCTLKIDNNNTYTGTGWTNGWALYARLMGSNSPYESYVKDNVFLSGTSFAGGRGMELREGNAKTGTGHWTDTVEVNGNYFDNHQGADVEYQSVWGSTCLKIRRGNFYYWIHDNTFIQTLDSIYATGANYHRHGTCVTYQIEMDATDTWRAPYHLTFEDNVCSLRVLRDSTGFGGNNAYIWGATISIAGVPNAVTAIDPTIKIRNNYFYSEAGTCVLFGSQWDASAQHILFGPNDTLDHNNDSGFFQEAYSLTGHATTGNKNIITKDAVFAGDAYDTSVSHYSRTGDVANNADSIWELTFQRTLELYVKGNNGLPVWGATVCAINDYGDTVITGETNYNGKVSGVAAYYYYNRNDPDSAGFNDFTIWGKYDTDSNSSILTVSWEPAGGTDTISLSSTAGNGLWEGENMKKRIRLKK